LYDVAFSWDVSDEVDWLLERLGDVTSVCEPACGSGRMFPAFVRRGVSMFGIDQSAAMLARATDRMASLGLANFETLEADITNFDAGRRFGGAICPISTFGYLQSFDEALAHLECMARHLDPGARYLIQEALLDFDSYRPGTPNTTSDWEIELDGVRVHTTVTPGELDRATKMHVDHYRFEIVAGPGAGEVVTEDHAMFTWDYESWSALIAASPFEQLAAYDGNAATRPSVPLDASLEAGLLTWHELRV